MIQSFQPLYSTLYTLGALCEFTYGVTVTAKNSGDYRFIRITDIDESGHLRPEGVMYIDSSADVDKKLLKSGDVVMARTGASFGKSVYIDKNIDAVFASFLINISPKNDSLNSKFLWYFMQSVEFWNQANFYVSRGGQPQFNTKAVSKVVLNLPPIAEQERIITILDRFDALVNDISSGLPAEIAARRKQYEYYRDKLLTFKELPQPAPQEQP